MRKTALILAFAIAVPAWAQDKAAEQPAPAAQAEKQEPEKAEAAKPETPKKTARKHSSKRMEDARHCLDKPTNTEIIKCAEAYL
jgi:hypothetical protein